MSAVVDIHIWSHSLDGYANALFVALLFFLFLSLFFLLFLLFWCNHSNSVNGAVFFVFLLTPPPKLTKSLWKAGIRSLLASLASTLANPLSAFQSRLRRLIRRQSEFHNPSTAQPEPLITNVHLANTPLLGNAWVKFPLRILPNFPKVSVARTTPPWH